MAHVAAAPASLDWPLMKNNISRGDLDAVCAFLQQDDPVLTQGPQVRAFEQEWSAWLGVRHSVFVNSGSSANGLNPKKAKNHEGFSAESLFKPDPNFLPCVAEFFFA